MRSLCPSDGRQESGVLRLLYVGLVHPCKGVHIVLESLDRLWNQLRIPCHLDIVGPARDAIYRDRLIALARSRGISDRVSFCGPVPFKDIPQCYRDHDVLVFSSVEFERFPLVILEAMASGLVVVSTLTGGHREYLHHGRNCLICRPGDPIDLTDRLATLARHPHLREKIAHAGMSTVRREFGMDRTLDQMEAFLRQVSEKHVRCSPTTRVNSLQLDRQTRC
jgi:glycosyltransferase involved in cell wall biosynthesis